MPEDRDPSTNPADNPLDFEPPSLEDLSASLEGIEVQAFIGKGPLGTVYKASQPKLDRTVALKIFPASVASESAFAKRFQAEAQTMAQMRHDHIMAVHDFGESTDGKWLYIAMEWVDGDTLERAMLKQNWDESRKLAVAAQLCDALHYAHDRGVIHRDLKPGNIMLADEGRIKIADFGMATIVGTESFDNKLTHSTASIGMPDFVAPEQLEPGNTVDHRADIYSVGVILYKMLTGYIPRGTYRPPSERNPEVDPRLDAVVARAMEADPAKRYQDTGALMDDLLEIHDHPAPKPAAAPRLVTGKIPDTALRRGAADNLPKGSGGSSQSVRASGEQDKATPATDPSMAETARVAAPIIDEQATRTLATTVLTLVGCGVLVLGIVGFTLFFGKDRDKAEPETIIASAPRPKPNPKSPNPSSSQDKGAAGKSIASAIDTSLVNSGSGTAPDRPATPNSRSVPSQDAPGPSASLRPSTNPASAGSGRAQDKPTNPGPSRPRTATSLPPGKSLDLLAFARPNQDNLAGNWGRNGGAIFNLEPTGPAKLVFPVRPSGDYRLRAAFTRKQGDNAIGFHLPLGDGREVSCFFDHVGGGGSDTSGLEYVDRLDLFNEKNPTRVSPGVLETGRRYTTDVTVRFLPRKRVAIDVLLDGEPYFNFEGGLARLSIYPGWSQEEKADALGLATSNSQYTVHQLLVDVLGGELALARDAPPTAVADTSTLAPIKPFKPSPPPDKAVAAGSPTNPPPPTAPKTPTTPEPAAAPTPFASTLQTFQKRYATQVDGAHRQAVSDLNAQYRGALERSQKAATDKGDLDEVLALRTELDALGALGEGLPLRAELPGGSPATIANFRATYADQLVALDAARDRDALPVLRAYDQALEGLQAKLTRELEIEDALAVKTAREELRERSPFAPDGPGLDTPLRKIAPAAPVAQRRARLPRLPPELAYPPARPEAAGAVVAWETATGESVTQLPEEIAGLTDVVAIDTANDIGIALRANGEVAVWGGIAEARTRIPKDLADVAKVACGDEFAVALQSDGNVAVWGRPVGAVNDIPERLRGIAAIPVGAAGIYALRRNGAPVIWGGYPFDNAEHGEEVHKANALVDIAVGRGAGYAVGLRRDGRLRLLNDRADEIDEETENMIEDLRDVIAVACNKHSIQTLALLNTGEVVTWGWGTEANPDFNPLPPDLPRDIDRLAVDRNIGAIRSRSKGWIFFGESVNAERAAANAAGCTAISFTGTRIYGLRP